MRLQIPTSPRPLSVYRIAADAGAGAQRWPTPRAETVGVLLWVLACSVLRLAFFVARGEHFGAGPALALAALCVTSYTLVRLRRI